MEQEYLDSFHEPQEFWYVAKDADGGEDDDSCDKWWIPTVRVPPEGLSEASKKWLQHQKELVGQVLKAAMAINALVVLAAAGLTTLLPRRPGGQAPAGRPAPAREEAAVEYSAGAPH